MKRTGNKYLQVAIAAAKEAGRIQRDHLGDLHKVEFKGEINPVSEVDKLCEKAINRIILDAFPDHDLEKHQGGFG